MILALKSRSCSTTGNTSRENRRISSPFTAGEKAMLSSNNEKSRLIVRRKGRGTRVLLLCATDNDRHSSTLLLRSGVQYS